MPIPHYDYILYHEVFKAMVAPSTMNEVNILIKAALAAGQVASAPSTSSSSAAPKGNATKTTPKSSVLAFF